ncbi:MAG: histidine--tRNA ligase [Candidatus Saccharimonadales bacterium]
MTAISTQNYKGARDFYPEEMRLQHYIFTTWRRVSERYGYAEVMAPILEFTDLYRAKTGEEIVSEQTYSFKDRGGRDVTIRPEMTPSVARMVAARQQELSFPLRWYSIPNLWRYERPQHGRLREHWQLNADIFGLDDTSAELEIISLAHALLLEFGATEDMFSIKLNSRELMSYILGEYLSLQVDAAHRVGKLLDRKSKMSDEAFINQADAILGAKLELFLDLIQSSKLHDLPDEVRNSQAATELAELARALHRRGVSNISFDLTIQRGFDYYTGIVFEIFDTSPENQRSLFGGGRYDDLLQIFKSPRVPAVGFGVGDVTMADFLQVHQLVPQLDSATKVAIVALEPEHNEDALVLADQLRQAQIAVAVDTTERKVGTKIKVADKQAIPYVLVLGPEEVANQRYSLKELKTGDEFNGSLEQVIARLS